MSRPLDKVASTTATVVASEVVLVAADTEEEATDAVAVVQEDTEVAVTALRATDPALVLRNICGVSKSDLFQLLVIESRERQL